MNGKKIINLLCENGYNVITRTEYHAQIETRDGYHDIWMNKSGNVKVKLCGFQTIREYTCEENLLTDLSTFNYSISDKASMQLIERLIKVSKGKPGIYCDAGWKDGKSRLAVVRIDADGNVDAHTINTNYVTSIDAEASAIQLAKGKFADTPLLEIYSDSQEAVRLHNDSRIKWLPRESTTIADKLANLRRKGRYDRQKQETDAR